MRNPSKHALWLRQRLVQLGTEAKAGKIRRYFPDGITTTGAMAGDLRKVVNEFQLANVDMSPQEVLETSEAILKGATYSEETLVAFALLNNLVRKNATP